MKEADLTTARRLWRFNVVGAIGIGVQFAVLATLARLAHLPTSLATAIAVAITVAHNFAWHERYTFRDRFSHPTFIPRRGTREGWGTQITGVAYRFAKFNLTTGAISVLGNVIFTTLLAEHARLPLLVANGAAIAICGLLNYLASDRMVFSPASRKNPEHRET